MDDAFKMREQALENQFFHAVDQVLVDRMREQLANQQSRDNLRQCTGIHNEPLLDELIAAGVQPETLVAFVLLPLAQVAWADGHVDQPQRRVVLNTVAALGFSEESVGFQLLTHWLDAAPDDGLFQIWCDYASRVTCGLSRISQRDLAATILRRSRMVAEATGGVLGLGSISRAEQEVLKQIHTALKSTE